jgi:putative transposase
MARPPRLIFPDVAVHIIQRGNDRRDCFKENIDYGVYLHQLRVLADELNCRIHAYCLMTNHVHLLLTPSSLDSCTALMRNLGQRYVQYFNRHHQRSGTLWEGRYRSCLAESAHYVLACYRYIELNPVRAGMVEHPLDYRWSSHAGNIGTRRDSLLSPHVEYLALGGEKAARQAAYRGLFDEALEPSLLRTIRDATNGGFPLASDAFKSLVRTSTGRKTSRVRASRRSNGNAGEIDLPKP